MTELVCFSGKALRPAAQEAPFQMNKRLLIHGVLFSRQSLRPAAAEAFSRMKAAAQLDGIELVMLRGFTPLADHNVSQAMAKDKASLPSPGASCSAASCRNHHTGMPGQLLLSVYFLPCYQQCQLAFQVNGFCLRVRGYHFWNICLLPFV
jgi:hypothetical protein